MSKKEKIIIVYLNPKNNVWKYSCYLTGLLTNCNTCFGPKTSAMLALTDGFPLVQTMVILFLQACKKTKIGTDLTRWKKRQKDRERSRCKYTANTHIQLMYIYSKCMQTISTILKSSQSFFFLNSEFFHLFFHSYVLYTYIYILIYIYSKSKQTLCLSDCGKICEQLY